MVRRFLSTLLIVVLAMTGVIAPMQGALATVTAQEALFGNGTGAVEPAAGEGDVVDETYGGVQGGDINDYPTLQLGDRDNADSAAYIVTLQNRLIALGFLKDSADGVYGENTKTAVDQFQRLNGLTQTGIADPETQRMIFSDMGALTTPSPENSVSFGSEAVRVQTMLIQWGFLDGSADGKLGSGSQKAIAAFKEYTYKYNPIAATPVPTPSPTPEPTPTPDPNEMPVVVDVPLATATPQPAAFVPNGQVDDYLMMYVDGEVEFEPYRQSVQVGSEGEEVRRVQTRLNQLGYLYPDADGAFGASTELALKYFQRKHGLSESGVADEATQRVLFGAGTLEAEEYVFPYKLYVDISSQHVYAFGWDGEGYNLKTRKMICSTGKDKTPTPVGTYQSYGKMVNGEWYYFKEFNCYAKWAYGIVGGILFHSVTYSASKKLNSGSVSNLGRKASHGCVRLKVEDAKWIYDNCPYGTTVVVQQ